MHFLKFSSCGLDNLFGKGRVHHKLPPCKNFMQVGLVLKKKKQNEINSMQPRQS